MRFMRLNEQLSQRYFRLSMILMFMMMSIHRFHNVFTFGNKRHFGKDLHAIIDRVKKNARNIQWHSHKTVKSFAETVVVFKI